MVCLRRRALARLIVGPSPVKDAHWLASITHSGLGRRASQVDVQQLVDTVGDEEGQRLAPRTSPSDQP